jgi:hypothetical protein
VKTIRLNSALPVGVLVLMLLSACARPGGVSSAATVGSINTLNQSDVPIASMYLGPITASFDYKNVNILVTPPGALTPGISWQKAYDTCASGESVCLPGVNPIITLALATSPTAGSALPDGSIDPLMNNTLVYVMKWVNEPCVPKGGPPRGPGEVAISPTPLPCTLIAFVDATSGKNIYGTEGPEIGS